MIIHSAESDAMINADHILYIAPETRMIDVPGSNNRQAFGDLIKLSMANGYEVALRFDTEARRDKAIAVIFKGFLYNERMVTIHEGMSE